MAAAAAIAALTLAAPAAAGPTFLLSAKGGQPSIAVDTETTTGHIVWNEGPDVNDGASSTDALHYCRVAHFGNECSHRLDLGTHSYGQPQVFTRPGGQVVVVKREQNGTIRAHISNDNGTTFPEVRDVGSDSDTHASSRESVRPEGSDTIFSIQGDLGTGFYAQATPLGGSTSARAQLFDWPSNRLRSASIGLADPNTPVAVMNEGGSDGNILFRKGPSGGDYNDAAAWGPPTPVGAGRKPDLASGHAGLFLASTGDCGDFTCKWLLREWNGSGFGAPLALTDDMVDYGADLYQDAAGGMAFVYFAHGVYLRYRLPNETEWRANRQIACDTDALAPRVAQRSFTGEGWVVWSGTNGSQYSAKAASTKAVSDCSGGGSGSGPSMSMTSSSSTMSSSGSVSMGLRCPADAGTCSGSVRLLVPASSLRLSGAASKTKSIGSGKFKIAGGKKGTAKIKLTSAGRALVRRKRSVKVTAEIRAKDSAGAKRTTKKKVKVKAPK
ncbi:MAG TPA: hypothetical protein VF715_13435 [Thermoleophilaceae bacterium]